MRFVRRSVKAFAVILCGVVCVGLQTLSAQTFSDQRVITEVSELLRWKLFWEGPQSVVHYEPRRIVDATVVLSGGKVAMFIGEIQVAAYLTFQDGQITNRTIGGLSMATVDESVKRYISANNGQPGFVLKPGAPEQPPDAPIRHIEADRGIESFKTHEIHFQLPSMEPPEYIVVRKSPIQLDSLIFATRAGVHEYRDQKCANVSVTIPLFSVTDPAVFVYVDFGKGCETGVLSFKWIGMHWTAAQFSPNRPPNDWTYTINQVHKYALSQFSLP